MNRSSILDTFETALLTELRRHVVEHPQPQPASVRPRRRRTRLVAAASTAVAASVVAVFGLGSGGGTPAYAVEQDSDGDVIVTVHRLDDAAGLEAALRAQGIDADVSYDATPSDGIYGVGDPEPGAPVEAKPGGGTGQASPLPEGADDPCGFGATDEPPASLTHEGQDWVLEIPAGSPLLKDNRHLDIGTTVDGTLTVAYAGDQPGSMCGLAQLSTQR